jgi:thiol-disulfide isomerase/thioredoxin/outer membrane lipoprotein-sorting protein
MRLAVLAALMLSSLCAQPYPDGAALVKQNESALRKLHSFQFEDRSTSETLLNGLTITDKSEIAMAALGPGKARFEMKSDDDRILAVSNGESTWISSEGWHEYTTRLAASGLDGLMAELGMEDMMPNFGDVPIAAKTIGEESVTIGGQKHDCWVVEMHIDTMDLPGPGKGKVVDGVMTHWFDKKLGIDLQSTFSSKVLAAEGGLSFEMRSKTVRKSMRIDEAIADSVFVFTPPPGAREVPKLSMFGGPSSALPDLAGKAAPQFTLEGLDGRPFALAALKGKPILLDFSATWCAPGRKSMAPVERVYAGHKERGLIVVAVYAGEEREAVEEFLKHEPVPYPVVLDRFMETSRKYNVTAYPTFVLIGADGKIVAHEIGFRDEETLRAMIEKDWH